MKKIVRLTESEFRDVIKQIVKSHQDAEMRGTSDSITLEDIFDSVVNAVNEVGEYDESMKVKAMKLAERIMSNMRDQMSYISTTHEDDINDILDEEY